MSVLFASVLKLDRAAIKALKITDPYSVHRVIYSLFADQRTAEDKSSSAHSGILYADQGGDFQQRKILMLSDRPPASCVAKQGGAYGSVETRTVSEQFLCYPQYRFKVIVNPTRRDAQSGKLLAVKGREAIAAWFLSRASQRWGFHPSAAQLQVDRLDVLQFQGQQQNQITLAQAHIQGILTVSNAEQFKQSFKQGLGRGSAFGCGLLQIVPMTEQLFV